MGDVGGGEVGHLFFCGAHEEEAGGVEELLGYVSIYVTQVVVNKEGSKEG